MSLISELKRRHVIQAGVAYLVVAWGAAQVAELIFDAYNVQPWVMQLMLAALAIGLPLVIVFSWFFDLRLDGLHWEKDLTSSDNHSANQTQKSKHESIAVLPFVNMSSDSEQEHFSDGISEELLNLLTKIPALKVSARTSSFSFKGKDTEIVEIGRLLNVAHVLEGSVRRSGSTVRITAQLIHAQTGYHLWSETWDRTLEDIFAVQDEIAAEVVDQLKITLLASTPAISETDPEAYALFLQARSLFNQYTPEAFDSAMGLLDEAAGSLLTYAPAWALRADIYASQANYGFRSSDEGYCMAREAAERALSIDENCTQAICSLGQIAIDYDHDLAAAAERYRAALITDPTHPGLLRSSATLSVALDNISVAIELLVYLLARDPINPAIHNNIGVCYYLAGRHKEAISSLKTTLRLSPGRIGAHYLIAMALMALDDVIAALEEIKSEENQGFRLTLQALAYHMQGEGAKADAALDRLIEEEENEFAYNIGFVFACRGEADQAFEWLEKSVEYHDGGLTMINSDPSFLGLHTDPRWQHFLTKIGNSKSQLDRVNFGIELPA
ncbi:MAG: tetratricopeptide repeat protein [Halioglobus sp.]